MKGMENKDWVVDSRLCPPKRVITTEPARIPVTSYQLPGDVRAQQNGQQEGQVRRVGVGRREVEVQQGGQGCIRVAAQIITVRGRVGGGRKTNTEGKIRGKKYLWFIVEITVGLTRKPKGAS